MANVLESLTNVLRALANHSEIQNQAYPQVFHDIYHCVLTIITTDLTDLTESVLQGVRQKPEKPLGEDGGRCPHTHGSALQAPERLRFLFLPRILRIGRIRTLELLNI